MRINTHTDKNEYDEDEDTGTPVMQRGAIVCPRPTCPRYSTNKGGMSSNRRWGARAGQPLYAQGIRRDEGNHKIINIVMQRYEPSLCHKERIAGKYHARGICEVDEWLKKKGALRPIRS